MMRFCLVLTMVFFVAASSAAVERSDIDKRAVRHLRRHAGAPAAGHLLSSFTGEFEIDTGVVCQPANWHEEFPKVAFDGTNYFVVWDAWPRNDIHVFATRFTPEGRVLDPGGIQVSFGDEEEFHPDVAFDGTNYLVVYSFRDSGFLDVYATRVTSQGEVLDPEGIPVSTRHGTQYEPAVAFDGTNYLVVWQRNDSLGENVYAARVTPQGTVLDPDGIVVSAGPEREELPQVTRLGTGFLVVWSDRRNGDNDIYAARVSSAGVVLDPGGIPITTAARGQFRPSVAWDGSNALVVWEDDRADSLDIYAARVTPQGAVLDPDGIRITAGANWQSLPRVAFDGTNYLVAWEQSQDDFGVWACRVTPQGTVLDPGGFVVFDTHGEQWAEDVAYGNGGFLVVWQDERNEQGDIFGARVTPQGVVLDTAGLVVAAVANEQWDPAAAFDGSNYLVAWEDYRSGEYADVYAARVSPAGNVLDVPPLLLVAADNDQDKVAATFDGTNYLVVWEDERAGDDDIYACRISPQGVVLDTGGFTVSGSYDDERRPAVARGNASCLIVWEDNRNGLRDVYGTRVAPDGTVLDPDGIPISTETGLQWRADVAFDGTNWLVVWQDRRGGQDYDIYAARLAQDGTVLDSAGLAICTASQSQWSPRVAFDGTRYLVVWEDLRIGTGEVYGARVTPDGTVLDPNGFCIAGGTAEKYDIAIACDGTDFLVVWADERNGAANTDIYGARVTGQGTVIDSFPVVRQPNWQGYPVLAHGSGDQMLLAYEGWAACNANRIWGKLSPLPGVLESRLPRTQGSQLPGTIVRGVLWQSTSDKGQVTNQLLDISGRKVMELQPGANDIRHLASGVYFVQSVEGSQSQPLRQVLVISDGKAGSDRR